MKLLVAVLLPCLTAMFLGCGEKNSDRNKAAEGDTNDTVDETAPTIVPQLTVSVASSETEATITVQAASDETSAAADLEYKIVFVESIQPELIDTVAEIDALTTTATTEVVQDWTKNSPSVTASGLVSAASYCFNVAVRDESNNISVYTPECLLIRAPKRIFLSEPVYDGNLGGTTGADASCNSDTNKPNASTYAAMIYHSTNRSPTINWVMTAYTYYYRADGTTLIAQTNANSVFDFDVENSIGEAPGGSVWVGLTPTWVGGFNCNDWTSNSNGDTGEFGSSTATDETLYRDNAIGCNQIYRLYCVEQ